MGWKKDKKKGNLIVVERESDLPPGNWVLAKKVNQFEGVDGYGLFRQGKINGYIVDEVSGKPLFVNLDEVKEAKLCRSEVFTRSLIRRISEREVPSEGFWISVPEAAEMMGRSRQQVLNLARAKRIKSTRIGDKSRYTRWLIDKVSLESYMTSGYALAMVAHSVRVEQVGRFVRDGYVFLDFVVENGPGGNLEVFDKFGNFF